jgi:citrate lyase subunit beta / citryl-CoA lyase
MTTAPPLRRSWMFVPGHKRNWYENAMTSGADAVIFDLEDAVVANHKAEARAAVSAFLAAPPSEPHPDLFVRINGPDDPTGDLDLQAVCQPGLSGVMLPKVRTATEVVRVGAVLDFLERTSTKQPPTPWEIVVTFETAQAVADATNISVASHRIKAVLGATAEGADINRALGYEFTPEGLETLYLRSRLLLAARQRNDVQPVCGLWQRIGDIEGLRRFLLGNRALGFSGSIVIHPSHVPVANEVFGLPESERLELERLIAAYRSAAGRGDGAVIFEGRHIDLAHCAAAIERLERFGARKES